MSTVFELIRDGKIPSVRLYEDDLCFSILDISPVNKGHALVISKEPYRNFTEVPEEVLCRMINVARKLDRKMRDELKAEGTNIMINNDPASGQEVPHLHIHVIPRFSSDGKTPRFSKEEYKDSEAQSFGDKLRI